MNLINFRTLPPRQLRKLGDAVSVPVWIRIEGYSGAIFPDHYQACTLVGLVYDGGFPPVCKAGWKVLINLESEKEFFKWGIKVDLSRVWVEPKNLPSLGSWNPFADMGQEQET